MQFGLISDKMQTRSREPPFVSHLGSEFRVQGWGTRHGARLRPRTCEIIQACEKLSMAGHPIIPNYANLLFCIVFPMFPLLDLVHQTQHIYICRDNDSYYSVLGLHIGIMEKKMETSQLPLVNSS